jgi:hypothetical protein
VKETRLSEFPRPAITDVEAPSGTHNVTPTLDEQLGAIDDVAGA